MRLLFILLALVTALNVRGATGDILGASITTNSCIDVYVEGFPTNTAFNNGFRNWTNSIGTNTVWYQQLTHTNALTLTMDAIGYRMGVLHTNRITRYGTIIAPKPYPAQAQSDIVTNGGSPNVAKIRVFLNDYIFTNTIMSNITVDITAQAFTNGAVACTGITNMMVTNLSTLPSPPVAGWFTVPGWTDETNSSMRLTVYAEAAYGVDSVKVLGWTGSAGVTNISYRPQINRFVTNRGKVWPDYQVELSQSVFTAGDLVRVDCEVYPTIGEHFSTLTNHFGTTHNHYPGPSSITNLCNKNNTLTTYLAVVSPTGSDATGAATNTTLANVNSAHEFLSVPRAAQAVLASNAWYGGVIYVRQGQTNVGGSTPAFADVAKSHLILRPYPGDTFRIETNTSTGTAQTLGNFLKVENCEFFVDGGTHIIWDNQERIWLQGCDVDFRGTAIRASSAASDSIVFMEGCWIKRAGGGLLKFTSEDLAFNLYGCDMNGFTNTWLVYVGLGNWHTNRASTNILFNSTASNLQFPNYYQLFAHNQMLGLYGNSTVVGSWGDSTYPTTNFFLIGNEIEAIKGQAAGTPKSLHHWHGTTNDVAIVVKRNSIWGPRMQRWYNENGYSVKQAFIEDEGVDISGWVGDVEEADGSYIGNWWYLNGMGLTGCAIPGTSAIAHGTARYAAYRSVFYAGADAKPYGWWCVFTRAAYSNAGDPDAFVGDYRIHSYSPLFAIPTVGGGYYDFDGTPRPSIAGWAGSGARSSGNPKNGGGFF